jgi:hypothetical protein
LGRHLSQPPTGMLAPHQPFLTNPPSSSSSEGKPPSAALATIGIGEETQISSKVENGRRRVNYSHNKTCDQYAPSTRHNYAPRADRKGINILEGSLRKTLKHIQPYRKKKNPPRCLLLMQLDDSLGGDASSNTIGRRR